LSYLYEDLQRVQAEAVELFLEVGSTEQHDYDLWRGLDPINRQRCEEIYRRFCKIATNASDLFQGHSLLGDDAIRDLRLAARKIELALRFRELTVCDIGELEVRVTATSAQSVFEEQIDRILRMLYLAEPEKGTTPTIIPITGGKGVHEEIEQKVAICIDQTVKRLFPDGNRRAKVDENGETVNHDFPSDPRKLRNQLTGLIRSGRTFSHHRTPLSWNEVKRVRTLGCRYLAELYGEGSSLEADFIDYMERTFQPWHTSANRYGVVEKVGYWNEFNSEAENAPGMSASLPVPDLSEIRLQDENIPKHLVLRLNKIHLKNALHILIRAARRCRPTSLDLAEETDQAAKQMTNPPNGGGANQPAEGARVNKAESASASAADWGTVEIMFLSDTRVQIRNGADTDTCNYAELGFADRRDRKNGKPNQAWATLRVLAQAGGTIPDTKNTRTSWSKLEKRMQEIRRRLREHFGIPADPLPFIAGTGYRALFKIGCGPSFHS
jgi:hypothetical protein